jgi:hypothetical protein
MVNTEKQAGDHVDARCTRCKEITNHTIIAMVEEKPARVRCNTCGGDHNYRPPRQAKAATNKVAKGPKAPRRTAADRKREALQEEWKDAAGQADAGLAVVYNMERSFRLNDLVDHPVFGVGVVKELFKPNKVEILFASGTKALRCKL